MILARPKGAALITSLPLVGYGYGLWERGSMAHPLVVFPAVSILIATWLLGHAGAMWLNAELDRDEGEVLLGEAVEVPARTGFYGYIALVLSVLVSFGIGGWTSACALVCALLSILYSHPRVALKGGAFGGPLVNGLGYGSLSPIAGWAAASPVFTWRAAASLVLAVSFILGVYFAAQAFQAEEDRARGYRTLVATHGPRFTLVVARVCIAIAGLGACALAVAGALPRHTLAGFPLWILADRHLGRWAKKPNGGSEDDATHLVALVTFAGVLSIAGVFVDHFTELIAGNPVGGCATAIVPDALASLCEFRSRAP